MPRRESSRRQTQGSQRGSVDVDNGRVSQSQSPYSQSQADGFSGLKEAQQDELIKRIIRFLLARNLKRRPTKRSDLTRHVFLGMTNIRSKQKVFNGALSRAQSSLRTIYGMEIVTLIKVRRQQTGAARASTAGFSVGTSTQAPGAGGTKTTAYVLASTLPEELRIQETGRVAEYGLLTVISCMIVLTPGCSILEEDLYRALQRVGIYPQDIGKGKNRLTASVRELIEREFPDQWYLSRDKEDGEMHYSLGPRMFKEISDETILDFVEAVYQQGNGDQEGMDETSREELQARLKEARGEVEESGDVDGETIELDMDE